MEVMQGELRQAAERGGRARLLSLSILLADRNFDPFNSPSALKLAFTAYCGHFIIESLQMIRTGDRKKKKSEESEK